MTPRLILDSVTPWPDAVPCVEPPTQPCPECMNAAEWCGYGDPGFVGSCSAGRVPLREIPVVIEQECPGIVEHGVPCEHGRNYTGVEYMGSYESYPCTTCGDGIESGRGRVLCRVGTAPITDLVRVVPNCTDYAVRPFVMRQELSDGVVLRNLHRRGSEPLETDISDLLPLFDWSLPWAVLLGDLTACEPEPVEWTDERGVVA